jgi:phage gpG-like protein
MIDFETTITTDLAKLFGGIVRRVANQTLFGRIGALLSFRIKRRTERGVDVHGRPFEPYSDSWAEERAAKGRQTGTVDLNFSGRMWAALQHEAASDSVEVFFAGHEATRAHGLNYGVRNNAYSGEVPQREFFGLDDADENAIGREIVRSLRGG